jgi:GNAT acetyltransferase
MLSRIQQHEYSAIKERHHERISQYPLINAVISATQEGFVYADPSRNTFFISTKAGFSLFDSLRPAPNFESELLDFLKGAPDLPGYLHIYRPSRSFQDHVAGNWDKYKVRRRAQFRYLGDVCGTHEQLLPPHYRIATIQEVVFAQLEEVFQLDFGNRYWNSTADFLTHAIGACILNEKGEPAAICYSACVVDGYAEMDTLVMPEYRGKSFMKIVSEPFFNLAVRNKLVPHWDTFVSNAASYRAAQRFQLQLVQEYDLLSLLVRT